MQRRTFIATVAASLGTTTLAGCVGGGPGDGPAGGESPTDQADDDPTDSGTDSRTETESETAPAPTMTGSSLESREDCSNPGSASITAESNAVVVEGCITGKNGCQVPKLADASYDADADELAVTVTTEKSSDADTCTQQVVQRGYVATVEFEGGLPKTTVVVHEGAGDEGEVARTETN